MSRRMSLFLSNAMRQLTELPSIYLGLAKTRLIKTAKSCAYGERQTLA